MSVIILYAYVSHMVGLCNTFLYYIKSDLGYCSDLNFQASNEMLNKIRYLLRYQRNCFDIKEITSIPKQNKIFLPIFPFLCLTSATTCYNAICRRNWRFTWMKHFSLWSFSIPQCGLTILTWIRSVLIWKGELYGTSTVNLIMYSTFLHVWLFKLFNLFNFYISNMASFVKLTPLTDWQYDWHQHVAHAAAFES